jgi:hypothetical protein
MARRPQTPDTLAKTVQKSPEKGANFDSMHGENLGTYREKVPKVSTVAGGGISLGDKPLQREVMGQGVRATSALVREAAREEALRFMPAVSAILSDSRVGYAVKLRLFETLLQFGVGTKQETSANSRSISVQAVIALQPRQAAIDLLPIANPVERISEAPTPVALLAKGIPADG